MPGRASRALSTASVYPETTANGFELAARLGYDAVEVMVGIDPISQEIDAVRHLSEYHEMPVLRGARAVPADHAAGLGHRAVGQAREERRDGRRRWAPTWSSCTRRSGGSATTPAASSTGIARARASAPGSRSRSRTCTPGGRSRREMQVYVPGWDPSEHDYANATIDLSHSAVVASDPVAMARRLGDRLRHIHMTDGTGSAKDEHLVPGRGTQPVAELLEHLAGVGFGGHVVAGDQHPQGRATVRPASST